MNMVSRSANDAGKSATVQPLNPPPVPRWKLPMSHSPENRIAGAPRRTDWARARWIPAPNTASIPHVRAGTSAASPARPDRYPDHRRRSLSSRRTLGRDQAAVHHQQWVAQLLGLVHVVGGQDEGDPLLLQPEQPAPQHLSGLRVQSRCRLVQQQHLGVVHQLVGLGPAHLARDAEVPAGLTGAVGSQDPNASPLGSCTTMPRTTSTGGPDLAGNDFFTPTPSIITAAAGDRPGSCGDAG